MEIRIRKIAIDAFPIHEGDVPGFARDCPVKRAYKAQMQEVTYKRIQSALLEHLYKNRDLSADELNKSIEVFFSQYEQAILHS